MHLSPLDWLMLVLLVIGGLNWGLVGLFQYDLVATIFGTGTTVANIVYVVVGVSALYFVVRAVMEMGMGSSSSMPMDNKPM